jgi:hypothetical protein
VQGRFDSYLYTIYDTIFCEFDSQRQPNLLPVAGGGCASPHSMMYCIVFCFLPPESSSEGIRHLVWCFQFILSVHFIFGSQRVRALEFWVAPSQSTGVLGRTKSEHWSFGSHQVRALEFWVAPFQSTGVLGRTKSEHWSFGSHHFRALEFWVAPSQSTGVLGRTISEHCYAPL